MQGAQITVQILDLVQVDHPRGCGEHKTYCDGFIGIEGSSPRMRGALVHSGLVMIAEGIIPADAGSTAP